VRTQRVTVPRGRKVHVIPFDALDISSDVAALCGKKPPPMQEWWLYNVTNPRPSNVCAACEVKARAMQHRHTFNGTGYLCENTGKVAPHCWTNHARTSGRLVPNSCEHCHEPDDKPMSPLQRVRNLIEQRESSGR
jgi:hypothetical protein